jgi:hypothetical protein
MDTANANDADDDALVEQANASRRVLLTQDRGLLCRRKLWLGAYVRGARPDDQFWDVLDRFVPPLAPWTRCPACNGHLSPAAKGSVDPLLRPAPGAATRISPAARTAARCTSAVPTASGLRKSSTPQSAPSAMPPAIRSYQRHDRTFRGREWQPWTAGPHQLDVRCAGGARLHWGFSSLVTLPAPTLADRRVFRAGGRSNRSRIDPSASALG